MSISYSDERPTLANGGKAWTVELICCGHAYGFESADTWQEADHFRESFCNTEGHDRAGIIRVTEIAATVR